MSRVDVVTALIMLFALCMPSVIALILRRSRR
jgi:hypothetical protein